MLGRWVGTGIAAKNKTGVAIVSLAGIVLLLVATALPTFASGAALRGERNFKAADPYIAPQTPADFPVVDPNYIYQELYTLATQFQHREAGYDTNLPPRVNGHDEFAAAWSTEMVRDLAGFGPEVRRDPFPIAGWSDRPALTQAVNVEVTVPGVSDPAQMVVIGCHYDGEAVSTQSANDDASGCAIELGVARALATYWRAHHLYPARTLRFVIFDAEEQGVYGSFHYLDTTINGDSANVIAMFNEEQSGIAYPLRYLGKASNPLLPFYAYLSPLSDSQLYPAQSQLSPAQQNSIHQFRTLMGRAVAPVFAAFQALGYSRLDYHSASGTSVSQPVFAPDQTSNVQLQDDTLGSSDQIAFTLAGVPDATFVGNATYYDNSPPPWSYPNDQPQDTLQLMNVYASGSTEQSQALTLALALPGMLTTWMLNQPSVLGSVAWDHLPVAAISDVGLVEPGQPLALDASASYDPQSSGALRYRWTFGDGAAATGVSVSHIYRAPGTYTLKLTATSSTGDTRQIDKLIVVSDKPAMYVNPYANYPQNGVPPSNPAVHLPALRSAPQVGSSVQASNLLPLALIAAGIVLLVLLITVLLLAQRQRHRTLPDQ